MCPNAYNTFWTWGLSLPQWGFGATLSRIWGKMRLHTFYILSLLNSVDPIHAFNCLMDAVRDFFLALRRRRFRRRDRRRFRFRFRFRRVCLLRVFLRRPPACAIFPCDCFLGGHFQFKSTKCGHCSAFIDSRKKCVVL